jgi:hypothetical protein
MLQQKFRTFGIGTFREKQQKEGTLLFTLTKDLKSFIANYFSLSDWPESDIYRSKRNAGTKQLAISL